MRKNKNSIKVCRFIFCLMIFILFCSSVTKNIIGELIDNNNRNGYITAISTQITTQTKSDPDNNRQELVERNIQNKIHDTNNNENNQKNNERLKYVPNEIIVKISEQKSDLISKNMSLNNQNQNIDLENLKTNNQEMFAAITQNNKYTIKKIQPLFKNKTKTEKTINNFAKKRAMANKKNIEVPKLENFYKITFDNKVDTEKALENYKKDPIFESVEPNYIFEINYIPNDPYYDSTQWGWKPGYSNVEGAWDIEMGNYMPVIAVIDTGVDWDHEDLAANIWQNPGETLNGIDDDSNTLIDDIRGYDFVDIDTASYIENLNYQLVSGEDYETTDNNPDDKVGHGTHVAGIAAAVADNNKGIAGVCPKAKIMPVRAGFAMKVYGNVGGLLETDDIVNAIQYAADAGADVINMSFGSSSYNQVLKDVLDYAYSQGVVLIASAGNGLTFVPSYPAGYPNVISVAATQEIDDKIANFSNFGGLVDVSAPGDSIYSTIPDNQYAYYSGTSMSSPFIAGAAGLIISHFDDLNIDIGSEEIRQILRHSVDDKGGKTTSFFKRINVLRAMQTNTVPSISVISSPEAEMMLKGQISIIGTTYNRNGSSNNYKLEYRDRLSDTGSWQLIASGSGEILNGVLATWDLSQVQDGDYNIRLSTNSDSDFVTQVIVDNSFQPGWPKQVINSATGRRSPLSSSIIVQDIDLDGSKDIILTTKDRYIYVYEKDGTIKNGWPQFLGNDLYFYISSPSVGDIDPSVPGLEILVNCLDFNVPKVYAFYANGQPITGQNWPVTYHTGGIGFGGYVNVPAPTLCDLNGDGLLEIVAVSVDARVAVLRNDGFILREKLNPYDDSYQYYIQNNYSHYASGASAACYDIDNDGNIEIVVPFQQSEIYSNSIDWIAVYNFNNDSTGPYPYVKWIQPVQSYYDADNFYPESACIADLDNDGISEIIATYHTNELGSSIYLFRADGTCYKTLNSSYPGWSNIISPPAIGDINGDGYPDIILGETDSLVAYSGYNPDIRLISKELWHDSNINTHIYDAGCVIGDIDGDGYSDIVFAGVSGIVTKRSKIFAINRNGQILTNWPKITLGDNWSSPTLDDLDNDGKIEVITGSIDGRIYIWDLGTNYNPEYMEWPITAHDEKRTGNYSVNSPLIYVPGESYFNRKYNLADQTGIVEDAAISIYSTNNAVWKISNINYSDVSLTSHINFSALTGNTNTQLNVGFLNVDSLTEGYYWFSFDILNESAQNKVVKTIYIYLEIKNISILDINDFIIEADNMILPDGKYTLIKI
ncbi:S8 family serine peptidase [Candidatus Desantisbacteria bacterium]|nr:S8 family serine peptidase [Candidatus Desantisbacteria bacterium]